MWRRISRWAWLAPLALGLIALASGLGLLPLLLVVTAWATVGILRRRAAKVTSPTPAEEILAKPGTTVRSTLAEASTEALCKLWTQTGAELKHAYLASTIYTYAELRAAILEELTRRDPDGVDRWLNDQPAVRDPGAYLHHQQL